MYGPQCEKNVKFWLFEGAWVALQYNHTVPVEPIASQRSSHLYQSTYKIWKQFGEDLLK